ncbi:nucleoside triphosphate pyrophosphatase [Dokdonella sp.]|uniref:Maf family protein n=1 Tax=Dokdonella sp. TaxID=2291710 RepID=UPI00352969D4
MPSVVLASGSRYRAELLRRLLDGFTCLATDVDESPVAGERPCDTAVRLARLKACSAAEHHSDSLVIGSDQVAELDGQALGKPGSIERAQAQLRQCAGKTVLFHTAVCVADNRSGTIALHEGLDITRVAFRPLDDAEISRYVSRDMPLDCAGSFKMERLGVSLFDRVECADPAAIVGLPLVILCRLLRQCGLQIP